MREIIRYKCEKRAFVMKIRFTLIELLVVIGIIAILSAILLPVLSNARASSHRTDCKNNLHGIGQGMHMYVNEHGGFLPAASPWPSFDTGGLPRICDVLAPELDNPKVFRCPSDSKNFKGDVTGAPEGYSDKSYYESEGTSYEYNPRMYSFDASKPDGEELTHRKLVKMTNRRWVSYIYMMCDYQNFHGRSGTPGSRNFLFIDGRVGDLK